MTSEIIWVYGSSAVGKETFIRDITKRPPKELIDRLGWQNKRIIMLPESIEHLAHKYKKIKEKRKGIIKSVLNLEKENTVLLIKGQDIDLEEKLPQTLKEKIPDSKHKILFLYTDIKIVLERVKKKPWWKKEWTSIDGFKKGVKYQIRLIKKLSDFEIISINNETKEYHEILFPPKL